MSPPSDKCTNCAKMCINGQNCIQCDKCDGWMHLRCSGLKLKEFQNVGKDTAYSVLSIPVESVLSPFIIPKMQLTAVLMNVPNGSTSAAPPFRLLNTWIVNPACTPNIGFALTVQVCLLMILINWNFVILSMMIYSCMITSIFSQEIPFSRKSALSVIEISQMIKNVDASHVFLAVAMSTGNVVT